MTSLENRSVARNLPTSNAASASWTSLLSHTRTVPSAEPDTMRDTPLMALQCQNRFVRRDIPQAERAVAAT
jgi:hypothetical protein